LTVGCDAGAEKRSIGSLNHQRAWSSIERPGAGQSKQPESTQHDCICKIQKRTARPAENFWKLNFIHITNNRLFLLHQMFDLIDFSFPPSLGVRPEGAGAGL
jgi:hypothetical protein